MSRPERQQHNQKGRRQDKQALDHGRNHNTTFVSINAFVIHRNSAGFVTDCPAQIRGDGACWVRGTPENGRRPRSQTMNPLEGATPFHPVTPDMIRGSAFSVTNSYECAIRGGYLPAVTSSGQNA